MVATKVTAAMSSRKGGYSGALSIADAPEENVNRFGIVTDQDFEPISNFKIDIECGVKAGKECGFLCAVTVHNPTNPEEPSFHG